MPREIQISFVKIICTNCKWSRVLITRCVSQYQFYQQLNELIICMLAKFRISQIQKSHKTIESFRIVYEYNENTENMKTMNN